MLPNDIINKILEYNPSHREEFKESLNQLPLVGVKRRIVLVDKIYTQTPFGTSYEDVCRRCIQDPEHVVSTLLSCNCCLRHKSVDQKMIKKTISMFDELIHICPQLDCSCSCRFVGNYLCRNIVNQSL